MPLKVEDHVYVELKEQMVVPIEVPVPTTLIEQKVVAVEHYKNDFVEKDRMVERVVVERQELPGKIQSVDRTV